MLKNYLCIVDIWGGDKIIKETVQANDPKKAAQRAKESIRKRIKVPNDMVKVLSVEIAK